MKWRIGYAIWAIISLMIVMLPSYRINYLEMEYGKTNLPGPVERERKRLGKHLVRACLVSAGLAIITFVVLKFVI